MLIAIAVPHAQAPQQYAVARGKSHIRMIQSLLEFGADIHIKNRNGMSPRDLVKAHPDFRRNRCSLCRMLCIVASHTHRTGTSEQSFTSQGLPTFRYTIDAITSYPALTGPTQSLFMRTIPGKPAARSVAAVHCHRNPRVLFRSRYEASSAVNLVREPKGLSSWFVANNGA